MSTDEMTTDEMSGAQLLPEKGYSRWDFMMNWTPLQLNCGFHFHQREDGIILKFGSIVIHYNY